ncbi:MAG: TIGR02099 family protein [Pseudomonadota bacterium]|nr:TIGR02099 family protein [Pseudomonadota bacterium]
MLWFARLLFGLVAATWIVFVVCWLSLHWLILPHIDRWRLPIEARASALLGTPVKIGSIVVRSNGWIPAFELHDVKILDAQQRVALDLPHVVAALSSRSLLALELRFEQLLIEGPSLDVRRDADGHIRIAGLDFGGNAASIGDEGATADWFFKQHEFVIRAGTLRWIDDQRQAPPLVLGGVDLVVRNGLRSHALRVDATPPTSWGERFSVRGRFEQPLFARAGDWRRWNGNAFAELPRADVRELRRYLSLPFELSEGDGALRGWFDVRNGLPERATVDLALRAVRLRLEKNVEPLLFEQIEGRIEAARDGDRTSVAAHRFGFVTGEGIRWPKGDLGVAWKQAGDGPVVGGEFSAERLDVGVMAQIAGRVPLGAAVRNLLADVHPQGVITRLVMRWDGPIDSPRHYNVKGLLTGLSLAARAAPKADAIGRPGLSNARVDLDATESGGAARIEVDRGVLDFPGVFAEAAMPFERLEAALAWRIEAAAQPDRLPKVSVKVNNARFANADASGELTATWHTGAGSGIGRGGRYPGELELDGRISDADAARTARYLPLGLPESVRSYAGRAVRAGRIKRATVRVRGDLWDFPFHNARTARDGEFRIAAEVDDLTFAYVPADSRPRLPADTKAMTVTASGGTTEAEPQASWPPLTGLGGELVVDRTAFELRNGHGRLAGVDWRRLHGVIGQLGEHARLDLDGNARGPLASMLQYVNVTPIGRWTGRSLAAATATGPADLKLALSVPLDTPAETLVKGSLTLAGNDVRMTADTPMLAGAKARIDFTQDAFKVVGGSARTLGGELTFDGGSQGGNVQRFSGQGTVSADALRRAGELGGLSRLAGSLTGQTAYRASLGFVGGQPEISVTSNLVGLGIELPPPFLKTAAAPLGLRIQTAPEPAGAAGSEQPFRETLQVELGDVLQGRFVRETKDGSSRVVRGTVKIGDAGNAAGAGPLPMPAAGTAASITLKRLDVDAWQAAMQRLAGDPGGAVAGASSALVFDAAGGTGYVPDTIALRVGELDTGGRRLSNLTAGLSQANGLWRANVDAKEMAGYVEYRPARRGGGAAGGVFARLSRLSLPKGEEERVESLLDAQPASVPGLDIVIEDFELRGKRLGRLEVEAANRSASGSMREWQLSKFNLVMPEAELKATGTWGATAGSASAPRRAAMDFNLALNDSGALLERLGMGKVVKGGKGWVAGNVAWPGSPLSPDTARMSGQIQVEIESGQFLKAGPGAARLLSVLSLQSLPRRLLFDFRDLFEEGFVFDNVVGDVKIAKGVATTNNLRMRGAAAAVLMEGEADLEHETEDLRVVVVPEINAGTASLAYAIINPAVGLGTFLAQYFLRKPLMAASTREFRVTGAWVAPKVERIERPLFGEAPVSQAPTATGEPLSATPR